MEELLTVEQVAEYLQVSMSTVRRMIQKGELPAQRVRRLVRVPRAAVEAYLAGDDDPLYALEALARNGGEGAGDKAREIFAKMKADLPGMVERVRALSPDVGADRANVLELYDVLARGGDEIFVVLGTLIVYEQARRLLRVTH
jgi:excisionase family DNA binding protein